MSTLGTSFGISRGCTNVCFGITTGFTILGVDAACEAAGGGGGGGGGGGAAFDNRYAWMGLSSAATFWVTWVERKTIRPMIAPCTPREARVAFQPRCGWCVPDSINWFLRSI